MASKDWAKAILKPNRAETKAPKVLSGSTLPALAPEAHPLSLGPVLHACSFSQVTSRCPGLPRSRLPLLLSTSLPQLPTVSSGPSVQTL